VYRHLASEIPIKAPRLIAASEAGDWMALEEIQPHRRASNWNEADYRSAIHSLIELHDRFWGLSEDLAAFPWLSRPLEGDFEVHVTAAANALEQVVDRGRLASWPERVHTLAHLILHADKVIAPLKLQPATLMHGDYWPGNISVLEDGSQVVFDWQMAGVGPPILDLVAFVLKSEWWFGELPLMREQIVQGYRERLAEISGYTWDEPLWEELWDHALMWRFLQEWMDLLAASPTTLLETRSEQLEQLWFEPLARAVTNRLL
jgi:thiamine kinase-like enzyme